MDLALDSIQFNYLLERKPGFCLWKIVIPMVLVVLMSWSVFWINPVNIGAQLTVSVTAILTLIVFQFSVAQLLPALSYLTLLDKFTLGTDFLVLLAFMETIITSFLQDKKKHRWSDRIDYIARFVFPVLFLGLIFFTIG